ncbi:MAG TPA: PhnD/SsuA/transferrin family substrate-binding protein [Dongiaceae bacterium]
MTASLPMYDLPELVEATDAWWQGLRRHLSATGVNGLPEQREKPQNLVSHWLEEQPLLSQTCGYPLTRALAGRVQLVATPRYSAPGCAGATYTSWVVVRNRDGIEEVEELRGKRVAFNGTDSQSGHNTLRTLIAPLAVGGTFFSAAVESGAHRRSMAMVQSGDADVAAVDCVSFALIARAARDEVRGLKILCATPAAPNLPYVTALATSAEDLERLRQGLANAHADPALAGSRKTLMIEGCEVLPLGAYAVIPAMEQAAVAAGYPELR